MQRIVIDTNVVVSALIQQSYPHRIIYNLFIGGKIQLCVSGQLMREYYKVLIRPKFSRYPDFFVRAEILLGKIETKALKYNPTIKLDLLKDKDDDMILELADECLADFIITGNTNDFIFPSYKQTKIVTPKMYWDNFNIYS